MTRRFAQILPCLKPLTKRFGEIRFRDWPPSRPGRSVPESFRAKRLHGLDRCGAVGWRDTGKEYGDQQKYCGCAIARRIEGRNPEEHGTQQTDGSDGAQAAGYETYDCRPRAAAQYQPEDSRA